VEKSPRKSSSSSGSSSSEEEEEKKDEEKKPKVVMPEVVKKIDLTKLRAKIDSDEEEDEAALVKR